MTYHVDRFFAAMSVLAGHGHIKQRLMTAFQDNLDEINDDELPAPMQGPFAALQHRMYKVAPLNGEGSICASVRKMSVDEASECAVSIVSLYSQLMRYVDELQETLPLVDEEHEPVPPFLIKSVS